MPNPVSISVDTREVDALIAGLRTTSFVSRIRSAAAQSVRNCLLSHFRARQAQGNAQGWPDKGFWDSNRADSVTRNMRRPRIDGEAAVIEIDSPALAHKITGGKIRPTGGRKYLAIPATPEAYLADSVRSFLGGRLAFVYGLYKDGSWRPALAATTNYIRRIARGRNAGQSRLARPGESASEGIGAVQFWLVRSAYHFADLHALPPDDDMVYAASSAATAELSLILEQTRTGSNPEV